MKHANMKGNLLIVLATLIWGTAFVAQSVGMEYIGPFTFISVRFLVGGFVTLIPSLLTIRRSGAYHNGQTCFSYMKKLMKAGVCCGAVLFISTAFQQTGLVHTTAGKAGFITALYVVLVPVLGLFLGKKAGLRVWIGVFASVIGMYLLCVGEGFSVNDGDLLILVCAFFFAVHILAIDRFAREADGVPLSCIQFFTVGIIAFVFMLVLEKPRLADILACAVPILYTGVLSCGVAYTLQIVAQKNTDPAVAALLFSLESVFAVAAGWFLLREGFSHRELTGCVLVLAAVVVAQLPRTVRQRRLP